MSLFANDSPAGVPAKARGLVAAIGGVCALFGWLVLLGWALHLPVLIQVRPGFPPMQYNTAICILLTGLALAAWAFGRGLRSVPVVGALVGAVGGLTLSEYLFQVNFGIDQLLFHPYILQPNLPVGRMSPVSALCFALIGISLILSTLRGRPRWAPPIAGTLSSVVASISLVAVLGYALDLPGTYGWGQLTKVALHTAVALGLAGGALFIIAWHTGLRPGETTPRWLPAPLMLGVFVASLIFYLALGKKQNEEIAQTVQASAESVKNSLSVRLDARSHALMRMAARWKYAGGAERGAWEDDATHYLRDFPDWQAIEWIDATHLVRWIVPLAGNEAKIGQDLTQEPNRKAAIEQAEREQQPVVTRMVTLFRGGVGFILYVPLQAKGQPDGFLAAVVDAQACLTRYLPPAVAEGEEIMLSESGRQFFQRGDGIAPAHEEWIAEAKVEARGTDWDLKMWPTPALAARLDSPMPNVILLAGVLGALMLGAVCYYAQRALRHAAETERANRALKTALDQVRTLEGLLPICSCCKRVRDDTGYWNQIDTYIHQHTNASLSHGYCPECAAKTFKEWGFEIPSEVQAQVDAGRFEQSRP